MLTEILQAAAASSFILTAGYGTGCILTKHWKLDDWALEKLTLRLLLGLGVNSLALFLIGCWLWNALVVYVALSPAALCGLIYLLKLRVSLTGLSNLITGITICVVVFCFFAGLSKPSGGFGDDAISYHLMGPSSWNSRGKISPVLDESRTAFPASIETLFAAGMLLSNDRAPGVIDTFFFAILLIQVAGLTRRLGGSPVAMGLAALLLATMPAVADFAYNGFVDVAYACFVIASTRLAVWPDVSRHSGLLSGAFAGLSAGTKYTGIMFASICWLLYAYRQGFHRPWRRLIVFPIAALFTGSACYIRNWVVLGSPIYPIPLVLNGVFHSSTFPTQAVLGFNKYILERGRGLGRGPQYLLALPFTYTFYTAYFHGAGGIGLAPLAFAPLGLNKTKVQKESLYLFVMSVVLTVFWFFSQQESRFLMPVVCIMTAFAGLGADIALGQFDGVTASLAGLIILISGVYGCLTIGYHAWPRLSWVRGETAEEAQRTKDIPYYRAFEYLNRTDNVKRVLVLDAKVPTYYLLKPYVKIRGGFGETPIPSITTPEEALREAGNMAVTHILEVDSKLSHIARVGCGHFDLVFSQEDARIYRCY